MWNAVPSKTFETVELLRMVRETEVEVNGEKECMPKNNLINYDPFTRADNSSGDCATNQLCLSNSHPSTESGKCAENQVYDCSHNTGKISRTCVTKHAYDFSPDSEQRSDNSATNKANICRHDPGTRSDYWVTKQAYDVKTRFQANFEKYIQNKSGCVYHNCATDSSNCVSVSWDRESTDRISTIPWTQPTREVAFGREDSTFFNPLNYAVSCDVPHSKASLFIPTDVFGDMPSAKSRSRNRNSHNSQGMCREIQSTYIHVPYAVEESTEIQSDITDANGKESYDSRNPPVMYRSEIFSGENSDLINNIQIHFVTNYPDSIKNTPSITKLRKSSPVMCDSKINDECDGLSLSTPNNKDDFQEYEQQHIVVSNKISESESRQNEKDNATNMSFQCKQTIACELRIEHRYNHHNIIPNNSQQSICERDTLRHESEMKPYALNKIFQQGQAWIQGKQKTFNDPVVNIEELFRNNKDEISGKNGGSKSSSVNGNKCNKSIENSTNGKTISHIKKFQSKPQCDLCKKCFSCKYYLKVHLKIHEGKKQFWCKICNKSYPYKGGLNSHMKTHENQKGFVCDICQKSYSSRDSLCVHFRTHTNERPFSCDLCQKTFSTKGNLIVHKRTHSGEKPFVCQICSSTFTTKGNLIVHMRCHSGERPFVCDFCPKRFATGSDLKVHKRIHTGERPYICQICQHNFSTKGNLNAHIRTHSGEKPFLCKKCNKAFGTKDNLKGHAKIHSTDKPYSCITCGKTFRESNNLRKHEQIHDPAMTCQCFICGKCFKYKPYLKHHLKTHEQMSL